MIQRAEVGSRKGQIQPKSKEIVAVGRESVDRSFEHCGVHNRNIVTTGQRESHAVMLFASEHKMDSEIWDSISGSTNAEEALHWKLQLYCAVGRLHALMEGLWSLYAAAEYYQRLYTGTIGCTNPIREAEPWKVISQQIGRTKPSRAPEISSSQHKKNDGRPPDTSAELLGSSKSNKGSSKGPSKPKSSDRLVGYPWANSCWLDSALGLLFSAFIRLR
ncbi:hypothetical protein B0H14DRAFT_2564400 [Mycena olivaceomarginata]|nr:hypothetical protein B0H14DRAFT_2564400 [Mycena olivaceomarginata]